MSGDIELRGHELGPLVGFGTEFHAVCSCGERFDGISHNELRDFHRQHCERIHDALVAPLRRDAARRGLDRARAALAEAQAAKGVA